MNTFDAADVVIEFFLEFVGRILLLVEILNVVVEDLVSCSVDFADFLKNLETEQKKKTHQNINKHDDQQIRF